MARRSTVNADFLRGEGFTRGTPAYASALRDLQRWTSMAGQKRNPTADALARFSAEGQLEIRNRNIVRNAGIPNPPQPGQRARITAYIIVGTDPTEVRRGQRPRTVESAPLTPDTITLLQERPRAFLSQDFGFDPDDEDYGVTYLRIVRCQFI